MEVTSVIKVTWVVKKTEDDEIDVGDGGVIRDNVIQWRKS